MRTRHIQGFEAELAVFPDDFLMYAAGMFFPPELFTPCSRRLLKKYVSLSADSRHQECGNDLTHLWLLNGGRLYPDTGAHPEYASPECATARDTVIWQRAGDAIAEMIVDRVNERIAGIGALGERVQSGISKEYARAISDYRKKTKSRPGSEVFRLYRNVIDPAGNSWAAHENHIYASHVSFDDMKRIVALHCISRIIWSGAGSVLLSHGADACQYRLSQREQYTCFVGNSSSTGHGKPLIHLTEKPYSSSEWKRLRLIGGDANRADVAMRLKFGTMMLLILMCESGYFSDMRFDFDDQTLLGAYHFFSADPSMRAHFPFGENEWSALDIQSLLLERAQAFFVEKSYGELTEEIAWQLEWWQAVLDCIRGAHRRREHPLVALRAYTDCGAKYHLICCDMEKRGYSWKHAPDTDIRVRRRDGSVEKTTVLERMRMLDIEYHRLSKKYGIFKKLPTVRLCTDEEIERAVTAPPANTRAHARRAHEDMLEKSGGRVQSCRWEEITAQDASGKNLSVPLYDPFASDPFQL